MFRWCWALKNLYVMLTRARRTVLWFESAGDNGRLGLATRVVRNFLEGKNVLLAAGGEDHDAPPPTTTLVDRDNPAGADFIRGFVQRSTSEDFRRRAGEFFGRKLFSEAAALYRAGGSAEDLRWAGRSAGFQLREGEGDWKGGGVVFAREGWWADAGECFEVLVREGRGRCGVGEAVREYYYSSSAVGAVEVENEDRCPPRPTEEEGALVGAEKEHAELLRCLSALLWCHRMRDDEASVREELRMWRPERLQASAERIIGHAECGWEITADVSGVLSRCLSTKDDTVSVIVPPLKEFIEGDERPSDLPTLLSSTPEDDRGHEEKIGQIMSDAASASTSTPFVGGHGDVSDNRRFIQPLTLLERRLCALLEILGPEKENLTVDRCVLLLTLDLPSEKVTPALVIGGLEKICVFGGLGFLARGAFPADVPPEILSSLPSKHEKKGVLARYKARFPCEVGAEETLLRKEVIDFFCENDESFPIASFSTSHDVVPRPCSESWSKRLGFSWSVPAEMNIDCDFGMLHPRCRSFWQSAPMTEDGRWAPEHPIHQQVRLWASFSLEKRKQTFLHAASRSDGFLWVEYLLIPRPWPKSAAKSKASRDNAGPSGLDHSGDVSGGEELFPDEDGPCLVPPTTRDRRGNSIFHHAAMHQNVMLFQFLLERIWIRRGPCESSGLSRSEFRSLPFFDGPEVLFELNSSMESPLSLVLQATASKDEQQRQRCVLMLRQIFCFLDVAAQNSSADSSSEFAKILSTMRTHIMFTSDEYETWRHRPKLNRPYLQAKRLSWMLSAGSAASPEAHEESTESKIRFSNSDRVRLLLQTGPPEKATRAQNAARAAARALLLWSDARNKQGEWGQSVSARLACEREAGVVSLMDARRVVAPELREVLDTCLGCLFTLESRMNMEDGSSTLILREGRSLVGSVPPHPPQEDASGGRSRSQSDEGREVIDLSNSPCEGRMSPSFPGRVGGPSAVKEIDPLTAVRGSEIRTMEETEGASEQATEGGIDQRRADSIGTAVDDSEQVSPVVRETIQFMGCLDEREGLSEQMRRTQSTMIVERVRNFYKPTAVDRCREILDRARGVHARIVRDFVLKGKTVSDILREVVKVRTELQLELEARMSADADGDGYLKFLLDSDPSKKRDQSPGVGSLVQYWPVDPFRWAWEELGLREAIIAAPSSLERAMKNRPWTNEKNSNYTLLWIVGLIWRRAEAHLVHASSLPEWCSCLEDKGDNVLCGLLYKFFEEVDDGSSFVRQHAVIFWRRLDAYYDACRQYCVEQQKKSKYYRTAEESLYGVNAERVRDGYWTDWIKFGEKFGGFDDDRSSRNVSLIEYVIRTIVHRAASKNSDTLPSAVNSSDLICTNVGKISSESGDSTSIPDPAEVLSVDSDAGAGVVGGAPPKSEDSDRRLFLLREEREKQTFRDLDSELDAMLSFFEHLFACYFTGQVDFLHQRHNPRGQSDPRASYPSFVFMLLAHPGAGRDWPWSYPLLCFFLFRLKISSGSESSWRRQLETHKEQKISVPGGESFSLNIPSLPTDRSRIFDGQDHQGRNLIQILCEHNVDAMEAEERRSSDGTKKYGGASLARVWCSTIPNWSFARDTYCGGFDALMQFLLIDQMVDIQHLEAGDFALSRSRQAQMMTWKELQRVAKQKLAQKQHDSPNKKVRTFPDPRPTSLDFEMAKERQRGYEAGREYARRELEEKAVRERELDLEVRRRELEVRERELEVRERKLAVTLRKKELEQRQEALPQIVDAEASRQSPRMGTAEMQEEQPTVVRTDGECSSPKIVGVATNEHSSNVHVVRDENGRLFYADEFRELGQARRDQARDQTRRELLRVDAMTEKRRKLEEKQRKKKAAKAKE